MPQSPLIAQIQPSADGLNEFEAKTREALSQDASPQLHFSSRGSQPTSPRDTPSVESFTQSQLGDDERSEESDPRGQSHPPRRSSLYLENDPDELNANRVVQDPVTLEDDVPIFLQETPADSFIRTAGQTYSPRSMTSSNNTPTRPAFTDGALPPTLPSPSGAVSQSVSREGTGDETSGYEDTAQYARRYFLPSSNVSSQVPYDPETRAVTVVNRGASETNPPQKQSSGDSKSTIRKVVEDDDLNQMMRTLPASSNLQGSARVTALNASKGPSAATDSSYDDPTSSKSRPGTSFPASSIVPRPSEDFSMREPSIDSLPSHIDLDRPPSPVSPYRPTTRETLEQRGGKGPIHFGLNHEFLPDSDREKRLGPNSHSRGLPSQDAQRDNIHEYPVFGSSGDPPPQTYPGRPSQDISPMLRQKAPEYQIEGMGAPIEWPSENQSRSRRGSRSSAFFKSLNIGKAEEPPLPNSPETRYNSSPINAGTPGDRKSKRSSIFRSLTGNSGSGSASAKSKENVTSTPNPPISNYTPPAQTAPPPPPEQAEDDEFPSRGPSRKATSKFGQRLQKPPKTDSPEQESGKKKRFSGIGVIIYSD